MRILPIEKVRDGSIDELPCFPFFRPKPKQRPHVRHGEFRMTAELNSLCGFVDVFNLEVDFGDRNQGKSERVHELRDLGGHPMKALAGPLSWRYAASKRLVLGGTGWVIDSGFLIG